MEADFFISKILGINENKRFNISNYSWKTINHNNNEYSMTNGWLMTRKRSFFKRVHELIYFLQQKHNYVQESCWTDFLWHGNDDDVNNGIIRPFANCPNDVGSIEDSEITFIGLKK